MENKFFTSKNNEILGTMIFESKGNYLLLKGSKILEPNDGLKNDHFFPTYKKHLSKMIIKNGVLQEDFMFATPSPASAMVRGNNSNGYNDWKMSDGQTLNDFLGREEKLNKFNFYDYFLEYKNGITDEEFYVSIKKIRDNYVVDFPIESLSKINVENYAVGISNNDSFCYNLEWGNLAKLGSIRGQFAGKFGLYKHADGLWKNRKNEPVEDPDNYLKNIMIEMEIFLLSIENAYYNYEDAVNKQDFIKGLGTLKNKLASLYYPEKFSRITSKNILINVNKKLDYFAKEMWDWETENLNHYLMKSLYEEYPELLDEDVDYISSSLWNLYSVFPTEDIIDDEDEPEPLKIDEFEEIKRILFIPDEDISNILRVLERKKNIILKGPPGVGKTFASKLLIKLFGTGKNQVEIVQFHQSYAYEDFIQGFRPTEEGSFVLKDGIFVQFVKQAIKNPNMKYFMIIDEINRGNLSKVFGELMLLIESDKRGINYQINLSYSNNLEDKFYIPENLHLVGTMNTADRSLAVVDYALRRRFAFFTLKPAFGTDKMLRYLEENGVSEQYVKKIFSGLLNLNNFIKENLGEGFEIGHSYFVNPNSDDLETWYKDIVEFEIKPLLEEYWFDNIEKFKQAISYLD